MAQIARPSRPAVVDAAPRTRGRPFGVVAVVVLLLLSGVSYVLDRYVRYVELGHYLGLPALGADGAAVNQAARYAVAGLFALLAVGMWRLQRWAWVATMLLIGASLGVGLLRYGRGEPRYVTMLLNILIVFYLNQRDVQALFRRRRAADPAGE